MAKYKLTLKNVIQFDNPFSYYHEDTIQLYIFEDEDGKEYVWKTGTYAFYMNKDSFVGCSIKSNFPIAGDICEFEASEKGARTYKGKDQIILTRCRNFVYVGGRKEDERKKHNDRKMRKALQLASIKDGDEIIPMDYKRYKDHYADCETVIDSYREMGMYGEKKIIDVIVRAGRLVPSGTRGKNFFYYYFVNEYGDSKEVRAVSLKNARKRLDPRCMWTYDHTTDGRAFGRFYDTEDEDI